MKKIISLLAASIFAVSCFALPTAHFTPGEVCDGKAYCIVVHGDSSLEGETRFLQSWWVTRDVTSGPRTVMSVIKPNTSFSYYLSSDEVDPSIRAMRYAISNLSGEGQENCYVSDQALNLNQQSVKHYITIYKDSGVYKCKAH